MREDLVMAGIQVAETSKPKRGKQVLDHLEVHPKLGGGHIVKHVYQGYEHEPKSVEFNEEGKGPGGEHVASHLAKHGGLPVEAANDEEETVA